MEPTHLPLLWRCCLWVLPVAMLARLCLPLAAALAAAGVLWALLRAPGPSLLALPALLAAMLPGPIAAPPATPGPNRVTGTVTDVVRDPLARTTRLALACTDGTRMLHCDGTPWLLPGDRVVATARCSEAPLPDLPPSLHVPAGSLTWQQGHASLPRWCAAAHRRLEDRLLALFPGELGPLLCTLVLGRGTRLDEDLAAAHRATGISHLLAVSGAHAAMLAFLLGLQPFGRGPRRRVGRRQAALGLSLLAVYAAITGCEPPVFRALLACTLAVLGQHIGRRTSMATVLGLPALLTAVLWPQELLHPSFQLSYAAVVGLWLAGAPGGGRAEQWFFGPLRASLWATMTTAPLTLFWFQQLAPWTILLTPLLAPLVGLLLIAGLGLATLALVAPAPAALLAPLVGLVADGYATVVTACDHLPCTPVHAWSVPSPTAFAAGTLVAIGVVVLWRHRRAIALASFCLAALWFLPAAAPDRSRLHLFAVGHGQTALLTLADGTNVVLDCGSLQRIDLPARKVAQALLRRRIDLLILTHADVDHCGSVPALLRRVPVTAALLPEQLRGSGTAEELVAAGTSIAFLAPGAAALPLPQVAVQAPGLTGASDNDGSLWVRVEVDGVSVLLTGDAEEAGVAAALRSPIARAASVLVLPHHGRANELASPLLDVVQPAACLVSNRAREGVSELGLLARQRGIGVWATGEVGDLVVAGGCRPEVVSALPIPLRGTSMQLDLPVLRRSCAGERRPYSGGLVR